MTIKSNYMKIKHNYNPFKMWGGWVGMIFYPLLSIIIPLSSGDIYSATCDGIDYINIGWCVFNLDFIPQTIINIIIGFLIGWGIHSFFRRWRRK